MESEDLPLPIFNDIGGGDIYNGGQSGSVNIGSNNNETIIQGDTGITLFSGITFKYDKIISTTTPPNYTVDDQNYFIDIYDKNIKNVILPEADLIGGRTIIISKGYEDISINPDELFILPKAGSGDTIDGRSSIVLDMLDQRITLISSGIDSWLII